MVGKQIGTSSSTVSEVNSSDASNTRTKTQSDTSEDVGWTNVDFVISNAKFFSRRRDRDPKGCADLNNRTRRDRRPCT